MKRWIPNKTLEVTSGCGSLFIHTFYNHDETKVIGIRADLGKSGTCAKATLTSYCELLTYMIKHMPPSDVVSAVLGASGNKCNHGDNCCVELVNRHVQEIALRNQEGRKS